MHIIDLLGAAVFSVSGALAAGRKRLDLIGVLVLALVTAVGGGTIRDILLARHPIFWLADPAFLVIIVSAALLTVAVARWRRPPPSALLVADALGLALFSVAGAQIAERAGFPALSCILLGTVTGSAGGLVRDLLSMELPVVLRRGNFYATAAIAGTGTYFILEAAHMAHTPATVLGMFIVGALRLASIWWDLKLPVFVIETGEHKSPSA